MWRILHEIRIAATPKQRLLKALNFIETSKLLLQLVGDYEMYFGIDPDNVTQDTSQIGNKEIY